MDRVQQQHAVDCYRTRNGPTKLHTVRRVVSLTTDPAVELNHCCIDAEQAHFPSQTPRTTNSHNTATHPATCNLQHITLTHTQFNNYITISALCSAARLGSARTKGSRNKTPTYLTEEIIHSSSCSSATSPTSSIKGTNPP